MFNILLVGFCLFPFLITFHNLIFLIDIWLLIVLTLQWSSII